MFLKKEQTTTSRLRGFFLFMALPLFVFALMITSPCRAFAAAGLEADGTSPATAYVSSSTDINMTVYGDIGVYAHDSGTASLDASVTTSGDRSIGAYSLNNSSVYVTGDVKAEGTRAKGLLAKGSSSADIDGKVSASGDKSTGAQVWDSSSVNIIGNVKAEGWHAMGLSVGSNSSADIDGNISVSGYGAVGAEALSNSNVNIRGNIKAEGNFSKGLYARNNSLVDLDGDVSASGDRSSGLEVCDNSSLHVTGNVSVSGDSLNGALAWDNSSVHVAGEVKVEGNSSNAVWAEDNSSASIGGKVSALGNNSFAVAATNNSSVRISGDIYASGNDSHGLYSAENSDIFIKDRSVEVYGNGSTALRVETSGNIHMDNAIVLADNFYLLKTWSGGNINAANGSRLFGYVNNFSNSYAGEELNITLNGGSYLEGTANDIGTSAVTNLALSGSGDLWRVTGNSLINGGFTHNGTLDYSAAAMGTKVTAGDLNGSGDLVMKTNIVNRTGDRLIVTGTTAGTYQILVQNSGSTAARGNELLTLVETADQNGSFYLTNDVALGAWIYSLRQVMSGAGAYWELYGRGGSSAGASGGVNTFYANYLLSYAETQTLIQRLGDLRAAPHLSGFWFRAHGGKFESNAKSFVKPFDMDYWGVQLGYDRKYEIGFNGDFYGGVMFGYSKADLDLGAGGNGDLDSKMVGLYGTFIAPSGFFADLVFKYQWMDNEFDVFNPGNERITGDGVTTSGFGASLELGKRIRFKDDQKNGWYMEPQVQFSYMRQDGGYFDTSNGLHVGVEPFTSILGRLGILMGYETEKSNFYAKISKVKEFDGDVTIMANAQPIPESFDGSWWAYGLGFTSKVNNRNSIYIDIERTSGGSFRQTWAAKVGWRLEF